MGRWILFLTDRQTVILFDVYVYIVISNGLQYNAHDSGYSNKQDKKIKETKEEEKGKKRGGGGEGETQRMETNRTKIITF